MSVAVKSTRVFCLTAAVIFSAANGIAQQEITVDSTANGREIEHWLKSSDARLVAWGAYFARENDEDAALPLLVDWVDGWRPAAGSSVVRSHEQHEAMAEVLDALIEAKAEVVPERIGPDRIAL